MRVSTTEITTVICMIKTGTVNEVYKKLNEFCFASLLGGHEGKAAIMGTGLPCFSSPAFSNRYRLTLFSPWMWTSIIFDNRKLTEL